MIRKKITIWILLGVLVGSCLGLFTGCRIPDNWWENLPDTSFETKCVTTDEGFKYYVDEDIGVCLLAFPDSEDIIVPEYIDEMPVAQLGYTDKGLAYMNHYVIDGSKVKKLTLQHNVTVYYISLPRLDTLVYVDILNFFDDASETIKISNRINGVHISLSPTVELKKGNHPISFTNASLTTIEIPGYVTVIDAEVFSGLENVIIKTSFTVKPDGWAEGWNGGCEVEWGVDFSI